MMSAPGKAAEFRALPDRPDVDQQRSASHGRPGLLRVEPADPGAGVSQNLVDGASHSPILPSGSVAFSRQAPGRRPRGLTPRRSRRRRSGCRRSRRPAPMPRRAAHCVQRVTLPAASTAASRSARGAECGSVNVSARPGSANQADSPVSQSSTSAPLLAAVAATVNACAQRSGASAPDVTLMSSRRIE